MRGQPIPSARRGAAQAVRQRGQCVRTLYTRDELLDALVRAQRIARGQEDTGVKD